MRYYFPYFLLHLKFQTEVCFWLYREIVNSYNMYSKYGYLSHTDSTCFWLSTTEMTHRLKSLLQRDDTNDPLVKSKRKKWQMKLNISNLLYHIHCLLRTWERQRYWKTKWKTFLILSSLFSLFFSLSCSLTPII